jgi:hypothetical protein
MFLVEEKKSLDARCSAEIYMRDDGLFEGRIHRMRSGKQGDGANGDFQVCGVTETLPRIEAIVDEELGL